MKTFEITVSFTGYQTMTVSATDEDFAKEIALDDVDAGQLQMTESYVHTLTEINPTEDDDLTLDAANLMISLGGSFAAAIGSAWIVGDSSNKRRVYAAFDDLFEKYEAWTKEAQAKGESK